MADGDHYGFTHLRTELRSRILHVTLDRPARRNAISPEMHAEFTPLFRRIATDDQVDVVVVTGAGDKAFCVGADFSGMDAKLAEGYPDGNPELLEGSAALVRAQLAVPQPVIAAINGDALGLGATLALFCDVTFLADTARIGDPHVNAGLVAGDGGAILWPLLLGVNRGKEYLMTGDLMSAEEALRYGLVNHVCPTAEVLGRATALAERLAAGPQVALRFNKRLANTDLNDRVNRLLDTSLALEAMTFTTADHREAVTAFLERRPPRFGARPAPTAAGEHPAPAPEGARP
ncbi:enoyl-CoA hydratase/isomerase family protein [Streptodolium elevatio]|uniref:Enoyl-CoA hydratase-related protein n=1 Tax=Streptodolium elevatio TaxID=3157996 RepID=A0ABV3DAZ6_9ACTN